MHPQTFSTTSSHWIPTVLIAGGLASSLSAAVLLWRGRRECGSAVAPINAASHWLWPQALRRDDASLKYTGTGAAIHHASAMLWAAVYGCLRQRRLQPNAVNAIGDAAAVAALSAAVDLKLVPQRLTPGFERRLSPPGLIAVYGAVAVGLALGGLMAMRRRAYNEAAR